MPSLSNQFTPITHPPNPLLPSTSVFGKHHPRPHWSFWWLPAAGLLTLLLALYLDAEIKRMDREIGSLEKLKYNYKTI